MIISSCVIISTIKSIIIIIIISSSVIISSMFELARRAGAEAASVGAEVWARHTC